MTAEKIADHINGIVRDAHEDFMGNDQAKQDSVRLIQDYAKQKCKEQDKNTRYNAIEIALDLFSEMDKHECSQYFIDTLQAKIMNANAPEPEFD